MDSIQFRPVEWHNNNGHQKNQPKNQKQTIEERKERTKFNKDIAQDEQNKVYNYIKKNFSKPIPFEDLCVIRLPEHSEYPTIQFTLPKTLTNSKNSTLEWLVNPTACHKLLADFVPVWKRLRHMCLHIKEFNSN